MSFRFPLAVAVTLLSLGCREEPEQVIELVPTELAAQAVVAEPVAELKPVAAVEPVVEPEVEIAQWRFEPPAPAMELEFLRLDDQVRVTGKVEFAFEMPELGDCVKDLPQPAGPDGMRKSEGADEPVWLALRSDEQSAGIRLSTRGALLVVDDGCRRVGDLSASLLGTPEGAANAVFYDKVAPEQAGEAADIRMRRKGRTGTRVTHRGDTILDISHFNGETMLTTRAWEDRTWVRLLMEREWEYAKHDGAIGREHTLVWELDENETPVIRLDNDYRYGTDGNDREELHVRTKRSNPIADGVFSVRAERMTIEDASMRVKAKKCPDGNGRYSFHYEDETVRWSFTPTGSKSQDLGKAQRRATFASSCMKAAKKETKRGQRLIPQAPKGKVQWHNRRGGGS